MMQPISDEIWDQKYRLKDRDGDPIDADRRATFERVASALADTEKYREKWREKFLWALESGAIPGGRIVANAGAGEHKPATSLINCTVSGTISDDLDGIMLRLHEAALTLKAGCGIGYPFSSLRPKGARVSGAGANTSGPLSFMDIFDSMCATISSAGGRRGAQMGTFDAGHPDIFDFIRAKRENGRLRHFNLSVLVPDRLLDAVKNGELWPLGFPGHPESDQTVSADELWRAIMRSTYDFSEPGVLFVDRINGENNNWFCEDIRATNPCGELPLPPNGSCLLGSVDLTRFVVDPLGPSARFDWERYREVVAVFTRMLDNVVDVANLPLPEQAEELWRKRRHGMGVLGVGSALALLGLRYGSPGSCEMVERWMASMALTGWHVALELAKEKGPAPIMEEVFPEYGGRKGKHLHAVSRYMRRIASVDPELVDGLARVGARFTHHTAIAPTGTIAIAFADNASNGIEPSFAHRYVRNLTVAGRKTRQATTVYSAEARLWEKMCGDSPYPERFVTAEGVAPKEHVDVQAAAQKWVDSSVSKCVAEGTAVLTNFGILKIEDLGYASVPGEFGDPISGLKVLDFNGDWQDVTAHYFAGEQETVKIYLSNGQLIEGSPVHRLQDNFGRWKKLADLKVGDGIKSLSPSVDSLSGGETIESRYASLSASVAFPDRMSDELALWLGMWCANGSSNLNCVSFCDSSEEIIELWSSLSVDLFGKVSKPIKDKRNSVKSVTVNSKDLSTWLTNLSGRKAEGKFVPRQIMMGSKSEMLSFLRGISLDGYLHKNGTVLYDGKSKNLADGIFSICSYLGLFPRRGSKRVSGYDYSVHYVMVKGFQDCIESHKNSEIVDDRRYLVQLPESWNDFHPDTKHPGYCSWRSIRQRDQEWARPSTLDLCGFEADPNTEILKVQEIEYGFAPLYDIEVKDSHSYLIDGVISHNTINVPSDISFEEFEDLYRYAHEKGLKGCATFRYNPEAFQGVLVTEDKLAGETYRFALADGTTVEVKGNETVEYDGETHTAANLFDALKEGKYGRF